MSGYYCNDCGQQVLGGPPPGGPHVCGPCLINRGKKSWPLDESVAPALRGGEDVLRDIMNVLESTQRAWHNEKTVSSYHPYVPFGRAPELRKRVDDLLARMEQERAPGHTDLMVTPESIDAFLEANPPPDPPQEIVTEEIVRDLRERVVTAHWNAENPPLEVFRAALLAVIPKLKERMGHE
jgi:hypothetical protein